MDDLRLILLIFFNNSLEFGATPSIVVRRVTNRILSKLLPNKEPGRHPVLNNNCVDLWQPNFVLFRPLLAMLPLFSWQRYDWKKHFYWIRCHQLEILSNSGQIGWIASFGRQSSGYYSVHWNCCQPRLYHKQQHGRLRSFRQRQRRSWYHQRRRSLFSLFWQIFPRCWYLFGNLVCGCHGRKSLLHPLVHQLQTIW